MIRARIYPTVTDTGHIKLRIDWTNFVNDQPAEIVASEEFQITPEKAAKGASYVTKVGFDAGHALPATFWIDENNLRHFHVKPAAGEYKMLGAPLEMAKAAP